MPTAVGEHEENALLHEGNFHSRFPVSTEYNLTVIPFVIRGATNTWLEGGNKEFRFCATKQELHVWLQGEAQLASQRGSNR
jgi:hypothetical protein